MLKKLSITTLSFVVLVLSIGAPIAQADTAHASARVVNSSYDNSVYFQFGIASLPQIQYSNLNVELNSFCGGSTGSGVPSIACGTYHPRVQFCYKVSTGNMPSCFFPFITRHFEGGANLDQYFMADISDNSFTGSFDNNFTLQGDNYYNIVVPGFSVCGDKTQNSQCSYWVELYVGESQDYPNGWKPYVGAGVPLSYLGAYWTPDNSSNNNGGGSSNNSTTCLSVEGCKQLFTNLFENSFVGRVKTIYQDFFSFSYWSPSNGNTGSGAVVSWLTVNPTTTNCDYSVDALSPNLPNGVEPSYNVGNGFNVFGKCCVGPLVGSPKLYTPAGVPSNFMSNLKHPAYFAPFYSCGEKAQQISQDYVLKIQNFLLYFSFIFILVKMVLNLFNLGGGGGSAKMEGVK